MQPAVMLDLHGYVNGTLVEPTTPPHGENTEPLFRDHPKGLFPQVGRALLGAAG